VNMIGCAANHDGSSMNFAQDSTEIRVHVGPNRVGKERRAGPEVEKTT
jgi:hypothetical protein